MERSLEQELRQSKERAEMLLNIAAEIIIWEDFDGTILLLNEAGHKILGYTSPELIGKNWFDTCIPAENRQEVQRYFRMLKESAPTSIANHENEVVTRTGERKTILWHNSMLKDENGKDIGLFSSGEDITDRKNAELALQALNEEYEAMNEELRSTTDELHAQNEELLRSQESLKRSEAQLRQAESAARIGHWTLDLNTGTMTASKGAEAIYGVDFETASLAEIQKIPLPEYRPMLDKALADLITKGKRYDLHFKIRRQNDGAIVAIHSVATFDSAANTVFGVLHDITRLKETEETLQKSVESLSFVLDASNLGYSDNDFTTGTIIRNERWAAMLGYTLSEIEENDIRLEDLMHPDDAQEAERITQEHLAGKTDSYRMQYRLRTKQGTYKWILDCGKVIARDPDGRPTRACGTHQDITEEKEYEKKIEKLLADKELLLKEVHHRIKNNMNTISSLLFLQAETVGEPAAVNALHDAIHRIQSMSILYDKLYRSDDYTVLSVREYLSALVDDVLANFPNGMQVTARKDMQEFTLDARRLQPLGIIVNELLTNTMKYAFKGRSGGTLAISASIVDGHITISVQDDGNGIPDAVSFENSTGFGLQLVQALTEQLRGRIRIERGNGTRVVLEFPA